jgi:hypothetical protein
MKNRAKCKLCSDIIESFHDQDYVECKCETIAVWGGQALFCSSSNWSNFLRVDDQGNEIVVTIKEMSSDVKPLDMPRSKPDKKELLGMLNEMIKNIDNLPQHAATAPITHYDFASALLLISELFKALDDSRA